MQSHDRQPAHKDNDFHNELRSNPPQVVLERLSKVTICEAHASIHAKSQRRRDAAHYTADTRQHSSGQCGIHTLGGKDRDEHRSEDDDQGTTWDYHAQQTGNESNEHDNTKLTHVQTFHEGQHLIGYPKIREHSTDHVAKHADTDGRSDDLYAIGKHMRDSVRSDLLLVLRYDYSIDGSKTANEDEQ